MRIFYFFFVLIIVLVSCNGGNGKKPDKPAAEVSPPAETKTSTVNPLIAYTNFINGLDTTDITNVSAAAKEFAQTFSKPAPSKADSGFKLFNTFYDKVTSYANEQHIKNPDTYGAYVSEDSAAPAPKSPKENGQAKKLEENGFAIATSEGSTYIKQDRNFISRHFYPYISAAMKEYLVQVNKENEQGFIEDAGLRIEPVELCKRVLFWENFIKANPSFIFIKEIQENQKGYMTFLLEGIDNSPLINRGTKRLEKEYKNAYEYALNNNPSSSTAGYIKPYYEALERKNIKAAESLLKQYKKQGIIYDYSA